MPSNSIVLAFDAYGTLLSTESIAKKLASHVGEEKAKTIAITHRKYQLEYTWRANCMGKSDGIYYDFSIITRRSLKHALAESGVDLNDNQMEEMMLAYDSLSTFPDVKPALEKLKQIPNLKAVVFSNGTHEMVSNSVNKSPDLSPHAGVFKDIVVVEECRKYKPAPEAYNHLARQLSKDIMSAKQMSEIWLVSGNPFDVVGGRACGMNSIWVDRAGTGWQDALIVNERGKPTEIVRSLEEVIPIVMKASQ